MAKGESKELQAYCHSVDECLAEHKVDPKQGLTNARAADLREKYGPNSLDVEERTPLWKLVLEQFDDLLVKILLGAAVLSFVIAYFEEDGEGGLSAFVEPAVILLILVINAIVGVWQESNAENALEALNQLQPRFCNAIREGQMDNQFHAEDLVPGDIVMIEVGDKVPADMRVLQLLSTTIRLDESAMTGESTDVLKMTNACAAVKGKLGIRDQANCVFSGTTVVSGRALCLVITTGMASEIGKIQEDVQSVEADKTPLKKKLDDFSNMLTYVIAGICVLVWAMNYKQFFDPVHGGAFKGCIYYLKIAVALGVAAIPEGLPAVITLCLALGTRKMVKRNAIIRKLPSVETLGCTTVICSDKTGTLTMNEMAVRSFVLVGESQKTDMVTYDVTSTGMGYDPAGEVQGLRAWDEKSNPNLFALASIAAVCNDARVMWDENDNQYKRMGAPTEAALKVLVEKIGAPDKRGAAPAGDKSAAASFANDAYKEIYTRMAVLEFSPGRKTMSVLARRAGSKKTEMLCKGAPERVLGRCKKIMLGNGKVVALTAAMRANVEEKMLAMCRVPLRVLGFAVKSSSELGVLGTYDGESHKAHKMLQCPPDEFAAIEDDMTFVGLAGIKDPARPEVAPAIASCRKAGIRVVMITGDNKNTAEAIAREVGIFDAGESLAGKSFTGAEFMALSNREQLRVLRQGGGGRVFSRTDPRDKKHLVSLFKEMGEIPAMTGDGVNDAPALKAASIGIAMGIAGTTVAKEASDMVLADDNFATIVAAVEEGRAIYNNMKAFIRYLISSNIGEVASIFLTAALGIPEGLVPVQLLWVNLVTDGPPATALGFNPPDADIMEQPPRRADDELISKWVFFRYMIVGLYVGFATVGVFVYWYLYYAHAGDGHTLITFEQLSHWGHCSTWTDFKVADFGGMSFQENPCLYFTEGKIKASTLSLSVLVTIEMFNALNALSEDGSLFQMPPWANPWLLVAMAVSFGLHFVILYVPFLANVFDIVPLDWNDWMLVLYFSFPVIIIDELLKMIGRVKAARERAAFEKARKAQ